MPLGETIVALSTPQGESAIAMIRLSGPLSPSIAEQCFNKQACTPRQATLGTYTALSGQVLDHGVFILYPDERSYTGEPMLEIHCHGNPLIAQKIIEDLVDRGCRIAEPGEFTRTAFCNKKLDLTQAEAVSDVICARSDRALSIAHKQLKGEIGQKISALSSTLLSILAEIEAYIDFPEEDLPEEDEQALIGKINALASELSELIETSRYHELLREGIKTVIMGAPNAGKSSLMNYLMGEERAIVSPEAGTTRDFISERIMIEPYCLQIIDTAGLHKAGSDIEARGIEKTLEKVREGDFFLLIIDSTEPTPELPSTIFEDLKQSNTLLLINKVDLPGSSKHEDFLCDFPRTYISITEGTGLKDLRKKIIQTLESDHVVPSDQQLVVNARQATVLKQTQGLILSALEQFSRDEPVELAASDLKQALERLGDVVGRIDNEAMLDELFSTFCIGK
tara:strand:+ start:4396 stop:5751 length:1356 start_codon:yes stop_codon:yes gene_type:complete